jgi:hypothetical protein
MVISAAAAGSPSTSALPRSSRSNACPADRSRIFSGVVPVIRSG